MVTISIRKPNLQWLFGGIGFHNSEATMLGLMTPEFLEERVLKSHFEISPTFTRVFAAFPDWTQEAMDRFADYYDLTFRKTDTTIYALPARMPFHETHEEMIRFASDVADKFEYLVKKRGIRHIRYTCATNELSVGNTYALLSENMERFKEYQTLLWREFRRRGLEIGLVASDGSGFQNFWQIDWCSKHMDEITDTYCAHNYEICGLSYDDRRFYDRVYTEVSRVVQVAKAQQKRFLLGEFGVHDGTHFTSPVMCNDVFAGYGDPRGEAETALMSVEQAMALINAGSLGGVFWSFCDFPDPMLRDWSDTPEGRLRWETARFSGHGVDIRYNKNGCFRWDSEEHDYSSRPFLYSIGLMVKYFKRGSRVLACGCTDESVLCCAVRNPDLSHSVCIVNLSDSEKDASVSLDFTTGTAYRKYSFCVEHVPYHPCNDLQPYDEVLDISPGKTSLRLMPHSMTLLTTDFVDRIPSAVTGIREENGKLHWDACKDEEHCYYRVYADGRQIASTAAESLTLGDKRKGNLYEVFSVDKWGNCRK